MIPVDNRRAIANLSRKSLKANRVRNLIAVAAIILTTVLFTTLFTIAGTIVNSFQQQTFRQVGSNFHGSFKDLTQAQYDELKSDPLIKSYGGRLVLGMPSDVPFNKAHVEVSYMDENCAKSAFSMPEYGKLPAEGTREIACDTRILKLLGVEPKIGAQVTLPYVLGQVNKKLVEDTFTLSGWWAYDSANMASQAIVARTYADEVLADYVPASGDDFSGLWTLNVFVKSTAHIEQDLREILVNHGFQTDTPGAEDYIAIGVNWAYLGAQVSGNADFGTIAAIAGLLLLIVFTGYLIIYNIFQISVTNDIRFYGLLKTLGATPRQLRRIIRRQALTLSLLGIPIGLLLGYAAGNVLTPVIMSNLSYHMTHTTLNPLIFLGAAAFSLVTVLISSRKPGHMAGKVSPVEAVRYTEGAGGKKGKTRKGGQFKIWRMALANLGRNKKKTTLVVLSLALAVVLLQITYTFANGFDMDKYLRKFVVTDFILGDASYFQTSNPGFSEQAAVTERDIETVAAQGGILDSARIYGAVDSIQELVTEDWYRQSNGRWNPPEALDAQIANLERALDGRVPDRAQLYGMEDFALDQMTVLEGDLAAVRDPAQNAIAAVYLTDDYNKPYADGHWAKLGDKVTLRYVDEWEYYDTRTGAVGDSEQIEGNFLGARAAKYRDVTYTVTALVTMRHSMSYRYYGADEFVLGAEAFCRDSKTSSVMTYLFNTTRETNAAMESFLKDYTENVDPLLDYESKASYVAEFESFRSMFLLLGGALSFIIALVGILNFLNAVLTSILTRRREFAMLQSVGMTGSQLKAMLVCEGVFYVALALVLSLVLALAGGPLLGKALNSMFWFFTYQFTIAPVALITPVFLALGALLPLGLYRMIRKQSIVERLRESE